MPYLVNMEGEAVAMAVVALFGTSETTDTDVPAKRFSAANYLLEDQLLSFNQTKKL